MRRRGMRYRERETKKEFKRRKKGMGGKEGSKFESGDDYTRKGKIWKSTLMAR
jgi:hypothetical protein